MCCVFYAQRSDTFWIDLVYIRQARVMVSPLGRDKIGERKNQIVYDQSAKVVEKYQRANLHGVLFYLWSRPWGITQFPGSMIFHHARIPRKGSGDITVTSQYLLFSSVFRDHVAEVFLLHHLLLSDARFILRCHGNGVHVKLFGIQGHLNSVALSYLQGRITSSRGN